MTTRIVCALTAGFEQVARTCAGIGGVELIKAETEIQALDALTDASGLITFASRYTSDVAAAVGRCGLSWIHLVTAGVDPLARFPPPRAVKLSSGGRAWSRPVAEHAVALLLALKHDIHLAERARLQAVWAREQMMRTMSAVRGLDLLLVGFGGIGRCVARLLSPFDCCFSAVARSGRRQDGITVYGPEDLGLLMARADAVVVAVPLGPATRGMIGAPELDMMKPGSVLIDVSRGGVVDPDALYECLAAGRIGGAALDVFDAEPLPPDHCLWRLPNAILTPHVAGFGDPRALDEMAAICRDNMTDFVAGRALRDGFTVPEAIAAP